METPGKKKPEIAPFEGDMQHLKETEDAINEARASQAELQRDLNELEEVIGNEQEDIQYFENELKELESIDNPSADDLDEISKVREILEKMQKEHAQTLALKKRGLDFLAFAVLETGYIEAHKQEYDEEVSAFKKKLSERPGDAN